MNQGSNVPYTKFGVSSGKYRKDRRGKNLLPCAEGSILYGESLLTPLEIGEEKLL